MRQESRFLDLAYRQAGELVRAFEMLGAATFDIVRASDIKNLPIAWIDHGINAVRHVS